MNSRVFSETWILWIETGRNALANDRCAEVPKWHANVPNPSRSGEHDRGLSASFLPSLSRVCEPPDAGRGVIRPPATRQGYNEPAARSRAQRATCFANRSKSCMPSVAARWTSSTSMPA